MPIAPQASLKADFYVQDIKHNLGDASQRISLKSADGFFD